MKLSSEGSTTVLEEVYSGVLMRTDEGNEIGICMRDDTLEINVCPGGTDTENWWRVNMQTGRIECMQEVDEDELRALRRRLKSIAKRRGKDDGR